MMPAVGVGTVESTINSHPTRTRITHSNAEPLALHKLARALFAFPLAVLHQYPPTREHHAWHARHFHALVEVVVGVLMLFGRGDRKGLVGIPQHNIGVGTRRDHALLRVD